MLGISRPTVEKYLDILEKSFIIFSLSSFSSNLRNEIKKSRKYYFYDTGIRNALTGDFNPLEKRVDAGHLWENFCISQRLIMNSASYHSKYHYFWRTYDGAEIDLVEEENHELTALEFKHNPRSRARFPHSFLSKYNPVSTKIISPSNFGDLISE